MRAVIQRVHRARVTVGGVETGAIRAGLLVYLGIAPEDGPTEVALIVVQTSDKKGIMITAWGSEEAQKENKDDINSIMSSIRAVK